MSASRFIVAAFSPLLLSLTACGYLGIGGSSPQPPAAPPVAISPAQSSPPSPLLSSPDTTANSSDDETAKLLAQKIAAYTSELPNPAPIPPKQSPAPVLAAPPASTPPREDALIAHLAPDALQITPFAPAYEPSPTVHFPAADNGDANLTVPDSTDLHPAASAAESAWEHHITQRVRDYPHDLEGQLNGQLLEFLQDRPVPDMSAVSALSPEDHEVLSAVMDGLSNFRNGLRADPNMLLSHKIAPLVEMADRLKQQAELTIPTVALCTSVSSFGMYTPVDQARFQAGRDNEVIVYCEVQNFASRTNTQGLWETKLTLETVLYTEEGEQVWPDKSDVQPVTDLCRNRRHDFFIRRKITLPANLSIQRYLLKVTVTDQEVNRIAEATTPVEMVSQVDSAPEPAPN